MTITNLHNLPAPLVAAIAADDYVGKQFGRLIVVSIVSGAGRRRARCQCSCGAVHITKLRYLLSGETRSCGCLKSDVPNHKTHGQSKSPEYRVWVMMKGRCLNPDSKSFVNYGGRGISVSASWMNFENFFRDMGRRPSARHTIERNDVNGGYCKENCRWIPKSEQALNKRNNRRLEFSGKTKTMAEWARETGIGRCTIGMRLRLGWSVRKALTLPVR